MKASIVDLRYRMKKVLAALRRRETVEILYHGKTAGMIVPAPLKTKRSDVRRHAFFGMHRDLGGRKSDVQKTMDTLRGDRHRVV